MAVPEATPSRWGPGLRLAAAIVGAGLLQTTVSLAWGPLGLIDWMMIVVGLHALRSRFRSAILVGAAGGLVQDALSGGLLGLHAFAKTLLAAGLTSLGRVLIVRGPAASSAVVGVAAFGEGLVVRLLLTFLGWPAVEHSGFIASRGAATMTASAVFLFGGPWFLMRWRRWRAGPPLLRT